MLNIDKAIRIASVVVDELISNGVHITKKNINEITKLSLMLYKEGALVRETVKDVIQRWSQNNVIFFKEDKNAIEKTLSEFITTINNFGGEEVSNKYKNAAGAQEKYNSAFSDIGSNINNKELVSEFIKYLLEAKKSDPQANRSIYIAPPLEENEISQADAETIENYSVNLIKSSNDSFLNLDSRKTELEEEIKNLKYNALNLSETDSPFLFLEHDLKRRFKRDFKSSRLMEAIQYKKLSQGKNLKNTEQIKKDTDINQKIGAEDSSWLAKSEVPFDSNEEEEESSNFNINFVEIGGEWYIEFYDGVPDELQKFVEPEQQNLVSLNVIYPDESFKGDVDEAAFYTDRILSLGSGVLDVSDSHLLSRILNKQDNPFKIVQDMVGILKEKDEVEQQRLVFGMKKNIVNVIKDIDQARLYLKDNSTQDLKDTAIRLSEIKQKIKDIKKPIINLVKDVSNPNTKKDLNIAFSEFIKLYNDNINYIKGYFRIKDVSKTLDDETLLKLQGIQDSITIEELPEQLPTEREAIIQFMKMKRDEFKQFEQVFSSKADFVSIYNAETKLKALEMQLDLMKAVLTPNSNLKQLMQRAFVKEKDYSNPEKAAEFNKLALNLFTPASMPKYKKIKNKETGEKETKTDESGESVRYTTHEIVKMIEKRIENLQDRVSLIKDRQERIVNVSKDVQNKYLEFKNNKKVNIRKLLVEAGEKILYNVDDVEKYLDESAQEAEEKYNKYVDSDKYMSDIIDSSFNVQQEGEKVIKPLKKEKDISRKIRNAPSNIKVELKSIRNYIDTYGSNNTEDVYRVLYSYNEKLNNLINKDDLVGSEKDISKPINLEKDISDLKMSIEDKLEAYENKAYKVTSWYDLLLADIPKVVIENGLYTLKNVKPETLSSLQQQYSEFLNKKTQTLGSLMSFSEKIKGLDIAYGKKQPKLDAQGNPIKETRIDAEGNPLLTQKGKERQITVKETPKTSYDKLLDIFNNGYSNYEAGISSVISKVNSIGENIDDNVINEIYKTSTNTINNFNAMVKNIVKSFDDSRINEGTEFFSHSKKTEFYSVEDIWSNTSNARRNIYQGKGKNVEIPESERINLDQSAANMKNEALKGKDKENVRDFSKFKGKDPRYKYTLDETPETQATYYLIGRDKVGAGESTTFKKEKLVKDNRDNLYTNLVNLRSNLNALFFQLNVANQKELKEKTVKKYKKDQEGNIKVNPSTGEKEIESEKKIKPKVTYKNVDMINKEYKPQLDNIYNQIKTKANDKMSQLAGNEEEISKVRTLINEVDNQYKSINLEYENALKGEGNEWIEGKYKQVLLDFKNKLNYINTIGDYSNTQKLYNKLQEPKQNEVGN